MKNKNFEITDYCENHEKNSLPSIRGGIGRGDDSFETLKIEGFQKKNSLHLIPDPSPERGEGRTHAAFTLAETLITLSILGIVAAITIPALVGRQIENQNRTKLKKAMTMYEKAINNMLIENDLHTEEVFKAWAKKDATENNYQEQRSYFKISEESTSNPNCRFKTADRIWWDICGTNDSNIENPIIILDGKYKDTDRSELETLAKTEKVDGKKVYVYALVGRKDATTGAVRVNDKAYEDLKKNGNYPTYMEKLYAFLNNRDMAATDPYAAYATPCTNQCEIDWENLKASNCDSCTFRYSEDVTTSWFSHNDVEYIIDENGNIVLGDEMLTPDSSRFWPLEGYEAGHGQPSYDKQFVRDWLKANPDKGYKLPQDIIDKTIAKYKEAYQMLTGKEFK